MPYALLMVAAGCLIAMQSPINAALSRRVGGLEASLVNFLVGGICIALAALFFGKGSPLKAFGAPPWQLVGGLLGAIMVFSAILAVPRIGVLSSSLAMIIGTLAMSSVIDNFGWFGAPVTPFTIKRLFGLCLTLGGLYFIFHK